MYVSRIRMTAKLFHKIFYIRAWDLPTITLIFAHCHDLTFEIWDGMLILQSALRNENHWLKTSRFWTSVSSNLEREGLFSFHKVWIIFRTVHSRNGCCFPRTFGISYAKLYKQNIEKHSLLQHLHWNPTPPQHAMSTNGNIVYHSDVGFLIFVAYNCINTHVYVLIDLKTVDNSTKFRLKIKWNENLTYFFYWTNNLWCHKITMKHGFTHYLRHSNNHDNAALFT